MQSWDRYKRSEGLLVVLSGPSGVGKDAVLNELLSDCPSARRCVTTTTRPRRDYEVDGVDYTFISDDEFRARIGRGAFLEHAEVFGRLYGTPRDWVESTLATGSDVILKIDVQGGLNVKQQMPSAVMIFLVPPSIEELERRLRGRGSEQEADIERRLQTAKQELEQIPCYDYIVENIHLDEAAGKLRAILSAEHCRIR